MQRSEQAREAPILTTGDSFHFACHDALPCFTQCCRDVNIFLTPYDVLRLRRALKMGSSEFLSKYTYHFLARTTHIPVVRFDMDPKTLNCKLVTEAGCSVYEDRPWACRLFPLDLGSREDEYTLIAGKERCFGLMEPHSETVRTWLDSQGIVPYLEMEREFHTVMPSTFKPGAPMAEGLGRLLFMAYDLDRFAALLNDSRFPTFYEVDEALIEAVRTDDEALLRLAFRYIRSQMEELYEVV